jgi:hypothetical protein
MCLSARLGASAPCDVRAFATRATNAAALPAAELDGIMRHATEDYALSLSRILKP